MTENNPQDDSWYQASEKDLPLLEYNQIFINNLIWLERGMENDIATFDLVVREMPADWNFYVFDGLERFVKVLSEFKFDDSAIELLKKMNLVNSKESIDYYKNLKFSGDVWAMKDGTIFFPGEPIAAITAPIVQANMLTALIMNSFSYPIRILTKSLRVKFASGPSVFFIGSLARLPGYEQGIYTMRDAYLLESQIGSPFLFRKFPNLKPSNKITSNINHAFIKSFPTEREAFRYFLDVLVEKADFFFIMVDTYELKKGLAIFIEEIKKSPQLDQRKVMLTIDSGDLKEQAFYVREQLDKNDLKAIRIQAMSSLDEYKIEEMVKSKTPIDCYVSAWTLINVTDCLILELVYKMAELRKTDGTIEYKAKLTVGKESYPGRKQVFRNYEDGKMVGDTIGLLDEKLGRPLLEKVMSNGELVNKLPDIEETKAYLKSEIETLPARFHSVRCQLPKYSVKTSDQLDTILKEVRKHHLS